MNVYRFFWDCGRKGNLEGIFAATQEELDEIIGKEVYFGEVLGKHSEIYGTLDVEDFTLLTEDEEFTKKAIEFELLPTGYNPFQYLRDE